jgi:Large-conductance mechanosensitive channel, MscL
MMRLLFVVWRRMPITLREMGEAAPLLPQMRIRSIFKDFSMFLDRGNILTLATGLILGKGFSNVVDSLSIDIITPFLSKRA